MKTRLMTQFISRALWQQKEKWLRFQLDRQFRDELDKHRILVSGPIDIRPCDLGEKCQEKCFEKAPYYIHILATAETSD